MITIFAKAHAASAASNEKRSDSKTPISVGLIVFPPYIQKYLGDQCFGQVIDDLNEIFPPSLYDLNINCATPARVYRDFELGKIDLTLNVKSTSGLSKNVFYSNEAYTHLHIVLYSQKDATDKTISSINKFEYNGARLRMKEQGYKFVDQSSVRKALTSFFRGATSHLISYKLPFEHYLNDAMQQDAYKGLNIDFTEKPLLSVKTFFVVNKRSKHALSILEQVNAFKTKAG